MFAITNYRDKQRETERVMQKLGQEIGSRGDTTSSVMPITDLVAQL